ncbi:hypothetical protein V1477_005767 [Vespula maculifrons]|uniref:Uncharacterized protein n=1 Tax=Vespula maculifrons TaxID=7453 RepID=A0ABD2CN05_VESMC
MKYSISEVKHIYFGLFFLISGDNSYMDNFMIATRIFLLMSWTLSLLTLAVIYNFALHVIRHLMCQIVKGAEVADAAHEFIKKLVNDMEPKLMREAQNYPTYRSKHVATDRILTKEGTSLAIVHVCIMKRKKKKKRLCLTTKFGKTIRALVYKASEGSTRKWERFTSSKGSKRKRL